MTKTWSPQHAETVPHWRRGLVTKKKAQKKYGPIMQRDGHIQIARRLAVTIRMETGLKLSLMRDRIRRANSCAPVSARQINGLVVLCGRGFVERLGLVVPL